MYHYFYPRSPCGERPQKEKLGATAKSLFLSTLSLRRATDEHDLDTAVLLISIHALLAESDGPVRACKAFDADFYPRSPCGERQLGAVISTLVAGFLSTLSLRRATPRQAFTPSKQLIFLSTLSLRRATAAICQAVSKLQISIHALLAESDGPGYSGCTVLHHFYPRSPCGERQIAVDAFQTAERFLSTLSLRRATKSLLDGTHPSYISIHALLAESDSCL